MNNTFSIWSWHVRLNIQVEAQFVNAATHANWTSILVCDILSRTLLVRQIYHATTSTGTITEDCFWGFITLLNNPSSDGMEYLKFRGRQKLIYKLQIMFSCCLILDWLWPILPYRWTFGAFLCSELKTIDDTYNILLLSTRSLYCITVYLSRHLIARKVFQTNSLPVEDCGWPSY